MQAAIYGFEGPALNDDERDFFRDSEPAGFILFRRNIENPAQLLRLTDSLRELTGRDDVPILIDQEGGRVARMRPPHWPAFPAAEKFADPASGLTALSFDGTANTRHRPLPRARRPLTVHPQNERGGNRIHSGGCRKAS